MWNKRCLLPHGIKSPPPNFYFLLFITFLRIYRKWKPFSFSFNKKNGPLQGLHCLRRLTNRQATSSLHPAHGEPKQKLILKVIKRNNFTQATVEQDQKRRDVEQKTTYYYQPPSAASNSNRNTEKKNHLIQQYFLFIFRFILFYDRCTGAFLATSIGPPSTASEPHSFHIQICGRNQYRCVCAVKEGKQQNCGTNNRSTTKTRRKPQRQQQPNRKNRYAQ